MKCPKCKKEMKIAGESTTNNQKTSNDYKEYKRIVYWCKGDDVWVNIETPIVIDIIKK